jgi:hypothetical protein
MIFDKNQQIVDTITDLQIKDNRAYIYVSDGSLIQFGCSNPADQKRLEAERTYLLGAVVKNFQNDPIHGKFRLVYENQSRIRELAFSYDPKELKGL